MRHLRTAWLLGLALFLCLSLARAQQLVPVPTLTGHVVDQANMLQPQQRQQLEAVLTDYETTTGSQIAVLLMSKTEPEAIEQFSIRVAEAWKLGRKGIDDGVILLVAKDNPSALRRLRIEAGRGVQGVLTDAQSKRILQDVIAPHFKQNQFYDGLVAGVSAISALLNQEGFAAPPQEAQAQRQEEGGWGSWLIPIVIFFVLASMLKPRRRSALARNGWGGRGMDAATGFVIGNVLGNLSRGGGGFGGGGFGDGGGFSGGGGSFDGGGASGDW